MSPRRIGSDPVPGLETVTEMGTGCSMTMEDDSVTRIRFYPDGPILVRGDFELLDEDGDPMPAARRTIALCRCGRTAIPPFCDGTHTVPQRRRAS
jgi:hypothetical protein